LILEQLFSVVVAAAAFCNSFLNDTSFTDENKGENKDPRDNSGCELWIEMDWFFPLKLLSSVATLVKLLIFVISLSYSEVIEDDVD